ECDNIPARAEDRLVRAHPPFFEHENRGESPPETRGSTRSLEEGARGNLSRANPTIAKRGLGSANPAHAGIANIDRRDSTQSAQVPCAFHRGGRFEALQVKSGGTTSSRL